MTEPKQCFIYPLTRQVVFHAARFPWRTTSQLFMEVMHSAASSKQRKDSMWVVLHLTDATYITDPWEEQLFHDSLTSELNLGLVNWTKDVDWWLEWEKHPVTNKPLFWAGSQDTIMNVTQNSSRVEKIRFLLQHLCWDFVL